MALMVLLDLLLIVAVVSAANVYFSRNPRTSVSLADYEAISMMPSESFREQGEAEVLEVVGGQLLHQIRVASILASVKMRRVRWAYFLNVPSVALWVVLSG